MKLTRRDLSKLAGAGLVAAAAPRLFAPALAQDKGASIKGEKERCYRPPAAPGCVNQTVLHCETHG